MLIVVVVVTVVVVVVVAAIVIVGIIVDALCPNFAFVVVFLSSLTSLCLVDNSFFYTGLSS